MAAEEKARVSAKVRRTMGAPAVEMGFPMPGLPLFAPAARSTLRPRLLREAAGATATMARRVKNANLCS